MRTGYTIMIFGAISTLISLILFIKVSKKNPEIIYDMEYLVDLDNSIIAPETLIFQEETKIEETQIEETQIEETKIEETLIQETQIEDEMTI